MKVKNIMFTGFAAAVLAGACGAADAATYTLASKDYVTNQLATKQNTLTAGEGIDITGDTISADLSTVTVQGADGSQVPVSEALTGLTQSVTAVEDKLGDLPEDTTVADALDAKQDTLSNASVLESITQDTVNSIGETAGAVAELETTVGTITNADGAESTVAAEIGTLRTEVAAAAGAASTAQGEVDALEAVVETKADAQDLTDGLALKEDVANKVKTATAEQIDAMTTEDKEAKYPSISVAQTIANAAVTKVNEVAGDLSTLQTQVNTNTSDIAELKEDKQDVLTFDATPTADSTNPVTSGGVYTELSGKQDVISDLADIRAGAAKGATAMQEIAANSVTEAMLATDVQTSLGVADTAVQPGANVSVLTNDAKYQTESEVSATIAAGNYLTSTGLAEGTYLVSSDGNNNVSYTSVAVIDGEGNELVLTPAAN